MEFITGLSLFLQTSVQMGTHLLFAILGGILCEKAGNMNLGIEGMMIVGAAFGYLTGCATGNPVIAVLAAGMAGATCAAIYAIITITLRGNQVVTGLVLTIFGGGVAGFMGKTLSGRILPETITSFFAPRAVPLFSKIPLLGTAFFSHSVYVYAAMITAVIMYVYFTRTNTGLNCRAVGENPAAADASGINVNLYKYMHVVIGGFLCGTGGAYLSLVFVPRWQENITAGTGWIAVAFIIFSTWNPLKAIAAAYAFGALKGLGFKMQNVNIEVFGNKVTFPPQLLDMIPYLVTIIVLVLMTFRKKKEYQAPAALGSPYFREER